METGIGRGIITSQKNLRGNPVPLKSNEGAAATVLLEVQR